MARRKSNETKWLIIVGGLFVVALAAREPVYTYLRKKKIRKYCQQIYASLENLAAINSRAYNSYGESSPKYQDINAIYRATLYHRDMRGIETICREEKYNKDLDLLKAEVEHFQNQVNDALAIERQQDGQ